MFKPVESKVNFPEMEQRILRFWKDRRIFARSVEERENAPVFTLYEGPPTANGSPGIHHVLARVFKDVIPRYKTMRGYRCPRKGGWDTHGLPVELEVERELGFTSKSQIEDYGIAQFNARCKENVFRYVDEWKALTDRIGFWIDMDHPYVTLDNNYIETCWWILKQLWDQRLLYQDYKVTPHCPRCGTSLSSHEVALGYKDDAQDPSIYVRFRLRRDVQRQDNEAARKMGWNPQSATWRTRIPSLLGWTTTPWTLTANVALAVSPNDDYVLVEVDGERLILAEALVNQVFPGQATEILQRFKGIEMVGLLYEPLYPTVPPRQPAHLVVPADFVSMEEGTGIVHIAPAYGEEDLVLGRAEGLPLIHTVDLRGNLLTEWDLPGEGLFVKEADDRILEDLKRRGLLYRHETIVHTYPFCWRCDTPLLYYAKSSWYIKTTAAKEQMLAGNEQINWYPEHIKHGRFGDWLRHNVDWAVSRERYWGTPLNIWRCETCRNEEAVGSLHELGAKPGSQQPEGPVDLHRPFVDGMLYRCPKCSGTMRRVPEVLDCWFDSGAMPFAQWHYPFENQNTFVEQFPAHYICEAVDQTRGWFYSLHALSTLIKNQPCYKNVICLGLILDEKGEKMSKSRGNVVEPWEMIHAHGADALRWYLLTAAPPGNERRFSKEQVAEALRKFFLTLWNTYSFFVAYANIDRFNPLQAPSKAPTAELDRWILSEANFLIDKVTKALDGYDPTGAGRLIQGFVERLSNWYVRRSRRRFWKGENDADKLAAYFTLYQCLVKVAQLMAPLAPFTAEELYQNLVRSVDAQAFESVHLTQFPQADLSLVDVQLSHDTLLVMRLASLGRAARSKKGLKVRQPLQRVLVRVRTKGEEAALKRLSLQLLDELNVKELTVLSNEDAVLEFRVRPNLPLLGPKYGRELAEVIRALAELPTAEVAAAVRAQQVVHVERHHLLPEEVLVEPQARPGYTMAEEGGYLVALTTEVTPELAHEGLARELVHRLQTMRRSAGFDIADTIVTYYQGDDAVKHVFRVHASYVKQETLSRDLIEGQAAAGVYVEQHQVDGHQVTLAVERTKG